MMDRLLMQAKGLYADRQRIALAALFIVFSITLFLFYSPGIYGFGVEPPDWFPVGWSQGLEVVVSFNTVAFFLAFSLMVFAYGFWSWAFLPSPASSYTIGVLKGIFGPEARIKQKIGKQFRVILSDERFIDITCRVRGAGNGDWFIYHIASSQLGNGTLKDIALRHGLSLKRGRLTSWIGNEELHSRTLLLAKAMTLV
jgi:hypothetical protein